MKEYSKGAQNIITDEYQVIRLTEGCPWKCPWCREPKEIGDNWQVFPIPEIVRNDVRITDMNLLAKKEALASMTKSQPIISTIDGLLNGDFEAIFEVKPLTIVKLYHTHNYDVPYIYGYSHISSTQRTLFS